VIFADRIRSVGKQACDESGKYPVNEMMKKLVRRANMGTVIARSKCRGMLANELSASLRAKRRNPSHSIMDRWIASAFALRNDRLMHASGRKHLAGSPHHVRKNENARHKAGHNVVVSVDSERFDYAWLATVLPSAACAAASRAIGTR
jgi:hypothetical protein